MKKDRATYMRAYRKRNPKYQEADRVRSRRRYAALIELARRHPEEFAEIENGLRDWEAESA